jgi:hypothetical protein
MNTTFVERSLPPSDRTEMPPLPADRDAVARPPDEQSAAALQYETEDLFVGREVAEVQPGGADELLPGLTLVLDQIGPAIDELSMTLGDLKLARNHKQLATFKAAAHRLASLANHVARTAKNYRVGEDELQQKE